MKKTYYFLQLLIVITVFTCIKGFAQSVTNGDFENWHTSGTTGRLVPDDWESSDEDFSFASIVQSTGYTGNYSVRLKYVGTNESYISFYGGPVTAKPYGVTGYWRDNNNNTTDQGSVDLYVYDTLGASTHGSKHTPFLLEIPAWEQFVCIAPPGSLANTDYYFNVTVSCQAINSTTWVDVDDLSVLLTGVNELDATLGNYSLAPAISNGRFKIS